MAAQEVAEGRCNQTLTGVVVLVAPAVSAIHMVAMDRMGTLWGREVWAHPARSAAAVLTAARRRPRPIRMRQHSRMDLDLVAEVVALATDPHLRCMGEVAARGFPDSL